MEIYLNGNFGIEKITDDLAEKLIKGSTDFDLLKIYIPTTLKNSFTTIYPLYSVKRADGRELGPYATITNADTSVTDYYGWTGYFNSRDLSVEGALEITLTFFINDSIKKTVAKVTTNVAQAVEVIDDIYMLNDSQIYQSLLASINHLATYAYSFANEVVQSYSDLANITTTNTQYRVVVLNDSNHDNNPSMYQWNGSSWDFKGYFDWTQYLDNKFDTYTATINQRMNNQDATIAGLGQLRPSGTDTSANILAKASDDGIWIGSDTGYWYYWDANSSQYVSGGVYQASAIAPNSVDRTMVDNSVVASEVNVTSTAILNDCNDAEVNRIYTISANLLNRPENKVGVLITLAQMNNYKLQLFSATDGVLYFRTYNNAWSSWSEISNILKCVSSCGQLNATSITNANNITHNSIYFLDSSITSNTISNLPQYGTVGLITTFSYNTSDAAGKMQVAIYYDEQIFFRFNAGTWTNWISVFSSFSTNVTSTSILDDFNNAKPNKVYLISNTSLLNMPINEGGVLMCYAGALPAYSVQFYSSVSGKLYYRQRANTWLGWTELKTSLEPSDYASIGMFEKIGVIGDSYASGFISYNNLNITNYDLAWLQVMARKNGFVGTNYASPGLTTRTWLSDTNGLTKLNSSTSENLYILALGINDAGLGSGYLGTISDINDNDPSLNADTFYGNYGKIIEAIKAKSPNAKIIMSTMAKNSSSNEISYNTAIVNIANHYSIPVIYQYNDEYFKSSLYLNRLYVNHPTAQGYSGMAKELQRLIEECIVNNPSYFNDYVG